MLCAFMCDRQGALTPRTLDAYVRLSGCSGQWGMRILSAHAPSCAPLEPAPRPSLRQRKPKLHMCAHAYKASQGGPSYIQLPDPFHRHSCTHKSLSFATWCGKHLLGYASQRVMITAVWKPHAQLVTSELVFAADFSDVRCVAWERREDERAVC